MAYDGSKGPNAQKAQLGPPDRWLNCPKIGKVVENLFLPFKTPLCSLYDDQVEKQLQFHPQDVFDCPQVKGKKIGMWIDLTKTDRFYFQNEVEKNGCKYRKIAMKGHGVSPSVEECEQFNRLCNGFTQENPGQLIAVHCTNGFNLTGFVIISYLCGVMDWGAEAALRTFAAARPTGIYKQDYINDLFTRFDGQEDMVEPPEKPERNFNEESFALEEDGGNEESISPNEDIEEKLIFIDEKFVGAVIGRQRRSIEKIQRETRTIINLISFGTKELQIHDDALRAYKDAAAKWGDVEKVTPTMNHCLHFLHVSAQTKEQIILVELAVDELITDAKRRKNREEMKIPADMIGDIVGKRGEKVKKLCSQHRVFCRPAKATSTYQMLNFEGTPEDIEKVKSRVLEMMAALSGRGMKTSR